MKLMGVLNVTPDSFSDGGRWLSPADAIAHGLDLWAEGADLIDVGAESTRPGSTRISVEEEWHRLAPVLPVLLSEGLRVSVDTIHADTARRAIDAGVHYVNDISGGCFDPEMNRVVAEGDVGYIVQHWRGFPGDPDLDESYRDVVQDVLDETLAQVERAREAGVKAERIVIDPGLGFALTGPQCWKIVENLGTWVAEPYPVLVGASRKRFVRERYPENVDEGTLAVTRLCWQAGVWGVRVHDVAANRRLVAQMNGA